MAQRQKSSRDHTVPQMYLKRWCSGTDARRLRAAPADDPQSDFPTTRASVAAETNFYRGEPVEGVPDLDLEQFLGDIETMAAPAFKHLLDEGKDPRDSALPVRWPPRADDRFAIAWWLSAQILRTARQRARLLALQGDGLELPADVGGTNVHLAYMLEHLAPLANLIYQRSWGIGFCGLCLMTSDVPVQVINAQDDPDQALAVGFWDIYVPLDPHRFLYLPGATHGDEPILHKDHRINFPGTYGIAMNGLIIETAYRHVFWHPDHDPRDRMTFDDAHAAQRARANGGSQLVTYYETLADGYGVERRWLTLHPWDPGAEEFGAAEPVGSPRPEPELRKALDELTEVIDSSRQRYESIRQALHGLDEVTPELPSRTTPDDADQQ